MQIIRNRGLGRALAAVGIALAWGAAAQADSHIRFAVIGDYGTDSAEEAAVAARVLAANPDFITTVGDNNYRVGHGIQDWDDTNGKHYAPYIKLPTESAYYGSGSAESRFFPILGNHDWEAIGNDWNGGNNDYAHYFSPPGNGRYYSVRKGNVEVFMLDSDPHEPDGHTTSSVQAAWLQNALLGSDARWKIVHLHEATYTSPTFSHVGDTDLRWDFKAWGADAVLQGNNHVYERLNVDGLPYFVNGAGGNVLHTFTGDFDPNSQFHDDKHHGFMLVEAEEDELGFQFIDTDGEVRDRYSIHKESSTSIPEPGALALLLPGLAGLGAVIRRRR